MHILLYLNLDFNKDLKPTENLVFILNNIKKYNCSLRNYWDDEIHIPQIEICGEEKDLRDFYNFIYKTEISNKDWQEKLSLGINA